MFTQHNAPVTLTATWRTCHFRHLTSEHYKVSKCEVFEKVIPVADFRITADDMCKKCKNWWMCVKAIASQTWDIF